MPNAVKLAQLRCPSCGEQAQTTYREIRDTTALTTTRLPLRFTCQRGCAHPGNPALQHLIELFLTRRAEAQTAGRANRVGRAEFANRDD